MPRNGMFSTFSLNVCKAFSQKKFVRNIQIHLGQHANQITGRDFVLTVPWLCLDQSEGEQPRQSLKLKLFTLFIYLITNWFRKRDGGCVSVHTYAVISLYKALSLHFYRHAYVAFQAAENSLQYLQGYWNISVCVLMEWMFFKVSIQKDTNGHS